MKPHEERVITEHAELDDKLRKLTVFISTHATFQDFPLAEKERLVQQRRAMRNYLRILKERIDNFPVVDA